VDVITLTPTILSPANYASISRCYLCNIWSKVCFLKFETTPGILGKVGALTVGVRPWIPGSTLSYEVGSIQIKVKNFTAIKGIW